MILDSVLVANIPVILEDAALGAAWKRCEAALPAATLQWQRAVSIGQYPPNHQSAGSWVALLVWLPEHFGNGPTVTDALNDLADKLALKRSESAVP